MINYCQELILLTNLYSDSDIIATIRTKFDSMKLQERIKLLQQLGNYMKGSDTGWINAKKKANIENQWFTPQFIELATNRIANEFSNSETLNKIAHRYNIPDTNSDPKKVGVVMAGNIPLVGFHDWVCVFLTGNYSYIKLSSRDEALFKHIAETLLTWNEEMKDYIVISSMIPNCEAYIATGSNNSSMYFEYYFRKYPSIIRKNRTSVAILDGSESTEQLEMLADDVFSYFGLGCRNVTKIYVPANYNFLPLLEAFKKYDYLSNNNKYKNNYEYNLALHILNNRYYMTNGAILLIEDKSISSPIGQLHYEYYSDINNVKSTLENNEQIQCIIGNDYVPFGSAQCPTFTDFADGIDTMEFLMKLPENCRNLHC